jgi:epoxyqueuosine reductase
MIRATASFDPQTVSSLIKSKALELGFSACGIAQVEPLTEDGRRLQQWLNNEHHGRMAYLENNFEKRVNPALLVDNARSVIVVLLNYSVNRETESDLFKIAKYAHGNDYHFLIKQFLGQLLRFIENEIAPVQGRFFCDSAPVFERRWAQKAGLGWLGLNRCLIHPQFGSFCFIGELIVDLELAYDKPLDGDCGFCGKCLENCPTKAIHHNGSLNASRCISYLTVELKDEIPVDFRASFNGEIVGCDRCQDVCPWNQSASAHTSSLWKVDEELMSMDDEDWKQLTATQFKKRFSTSSLARLGYNKLAQNMEYVIEKH